MATYLRIRLRAVGLSRRVQRNNLVPNHIVARRKVGNGQVPAEVVLDQVIGYPGAGVAAALPRALLDLGPFQRERVDCAEVSGDGRTVLDHGTWNLSARYSFRFPSLNYGLTPLPEEKE
jgi:hypothetical protein